YRGGGRRRPVGPGGEFQRQHAGQRKRPDPGTCRRDRAPAGRRRHRPGRPQARSQRRPARPLGPAHRTASVPARAAAPGAGRRKPAGQQVLPPGGSSSVGCRSVLRERWCRMFRLAACFVLILCPHVRAGVDLASLPANTWVPIKPAIVQPANEEERGQWINAGWNKLVYDSDGKRVLFYDRWYDKKHGGTTIYGNCLFSFDPADARLTPLKIDNWTKRNTPGGGYRTVLLPANDAEPTPCSRHVYHGFDYVPDLKAVFICNGANQTAMRGDKLLGHLLCSDTWRLDLQKLGWHKIASDVHPPNRLEDGMAYCPDVKSLVYAGHERIWLLPISKGQWRKATSDLPRYHMGMTVFHDAPRKRMLLA